MTTKQALLTEEDIDTFKAQGALELPQQDKGKRPLVWLSSSGHLHRLDGPAVITIQDMTLLYESWMRSGRLYRVNGPAIVTYHPNGRVAHKVWVHNDEPHRYDGPAILFYHQNGQCTEERWMHKGKCHRNKRPAIRRFDETGLLVSEEWLCKDLHSRRGGPVIVTYYPCGKVRSEAYILNPGAGETQDVFYRLDGSIERRIWGKNNETHRENGEPAIIDYDDNGRVLDGQWLRNGEPDPRIAAHHKALWKKKFVHSRPRPHTKGEIAQARTALSTEK